MPPKVKDIKKQLTAAGWYFDSCKGDHRQYKHAVMKGKVTVPGKDNDMVKPGTLKSIKRQAGWAQ